MEKRSFSILLASTPPSRSNTFWNAFVRPALSHAIYHPSNAMLNAMYDTPKHSINSSIGLISNSSIQPTFTSPSLCLPPSPSLSPSPTIPVPTIFLNTPIFRSKPSSRACISSSAVTPLPAMPAPVLPL